MIRIFSIIATFALTGCTGHAQQPTLVGQLPGTVAATVEEKKPPQIDIIIEKDFLYDKYTLADSYPYKNVQREFQWVQIRDSLHSLELQQYGSKAQWATLQNYKDLKGVAPLVEDPEKDEYNSITDQYGVSRYQSIPLYTPEDLSRPERYGRDGALVSHLRDSADWTLVRVTTHGGEWWVPTRYIKEMDVNTFGKVIFVDRRNQNIATLEKSGDKWLVRSMNPATTGLHRPPYQMETPLGVYVIQEKKQKMFYMGDGTGVIEGYSPYASRFTRGGYIHGVPINNPEATQLIEFSASLGTTPRSHMCVRNATSHAKYVYEWAPTLEALVYIIE